jgi:hypothetical protein
MIGYKRKKEIKFRGELNCRRTENSCEERTESTGRRRNSRLQKLRETWTRK